MLCWIRKLLGAFQLRANVRNSKVSTIPDPRHSDSKWRWELLSCLIAGAGMCNIYTWFYVPWTRNCIFTPAFMSHTWARLKGDRATTSSAFNVLLMCYFLQWEAESGRRGLSIGSLVDPESTCNTSPIHQKSVTDCNVTPIVLIDGAVMYRSLKSNVVSRWTRNETAAAFNSSLPPNIDPDAEVLYVIKKSKNRLGDVSNSRHVTARAALTSKWEWLSNLHAY